MEATLLREARAPDTSRPCMGLAPGAKGCPRLRPSGVFPVAEPYTTLLVIVRMLQGWQEAGAGAWQHLLG